MLTDTTTYDCITILSDGQIQVRQARVILDSGVEVTRTFSRTVLVPGQDVSAYPQRIKDICVLIWTPEVTQAFYTNRSQQV